MHLEDLVNIFIMETKAIENYEIPTVKVIEVEVEKGFAVSIGTGESEEGD